MGRIQGFKDSKDFIQESTISYIHQEYVVCKNQTTGVHDDISMIRH